MTDETVIIPIDLDTYILGKGVLDKALDIWVKDVRISELQSKVTLWN
jgi:hypothetical protein